MANLKIGDTVRLKSGGPLMTVTYAEGITLECTWFDSSEKMQFGKFHTEAVEISDDDFIVD